MPFKKGQIPWNKNLKGYNAGEKNHFYGKTHTKESRKKISDAGKGKIVSKETRKKLSISGKGKHFYWKGKKMKEEHRRKMSKAHKGEKCHLWKGGITPKNRKIRMGIEFRLWREAVFARDNWTCQKYGIKGGKLHPHHIQNFAQYPELRFAIDNGITLSEKAHGEFHKKYGKRNNTREQLNKFLVE